jgi:hypothetical protein
MQVLHTEPGQSWVARGDSDDYRRMAKVEEDKFVITGFAARPSKIRPIKEWARAHDKTFSSVVRDALFAWWEQQQAREGIKPARATQ